MQANFLNNPIIIEDIDNILYSNIDWSYFHGKNVVVTGAAGFLASYVVEVLLSLKKINIFPNKIIAVVRDRAKALHRFSSYINDENLMIYNGDVCGVLSFDCKVDVVIHAASIASPKYYKVKPVETIMANVLGTTNLLELIKNNTDSKFLYFSSAEIYGRLNTEHGLIREQDMGYLDCMDIRSCYAESKRMGENICASYAHQFGVNTVMVRPFHTYGPGMSLDDGRVFSDFVADIISKRDITLKSDGLSKRAFCYISDAIQGIFSILLNGGNATAYNLGNPSQEISIRDLAFLLADEFRSFEINVAFKERSNTDSYIPSTVERSSPDISKANGVNWHPKITVRDGFRRTVDSFLWEG